MQAVDPKKLWSDLIALSPQLALSPPGLAFASFCDAVEAMDDQRFYRALDLLNTAAALLPENVLPRWHCAIGYNRSLCRLSIGDYGGFREFAFRKVFHCHPGDRVPLPDWYGEDIAGKRLLLYQEMGYGDVIMMLRYVPILKRMGIRVTLMIDTPLHPLAAQLDVNMVGELVNGDGFDFKCPMFGLMNALKQTMETVPRDPYLRAPSSFDLPGHLPKIGIAWSGSKKFAHDARRSIPLPQFLKLLNAEGYELYSLQTTDLEETKSFGVKIKELKSFADTANLIAAMDHVVCVDTAPIHVAGAIGHPSAHVLLPFAQEWRWRHGDVWYPTLYRHRQNAPGEWAAPFAEIVRSLKCEQAA